jgi:hypothetical protein
MLQAIVQLTHSLRRRIYSFYLGLRATRFLPVPPGSRARPTHEKPTLFLTREEFTNLVGGCDVA